MKRFLTVLVSCAAAMSMWALEVNTPGTLANLVDDTSITQLTISGTIDARDFKFISDKLNNLEQLDLRNARIVAYTNTKSPVFLSTTSYEENAIPTTALMGKKLRSIELPSNIKKIDLAAFAGCELLESIDFPESLEEIGPYAFSSCNKLSSVTIPTDLNEMGEGAFSRCNRLESVSIKTAGSFIVAKDAFQDCPALSMVKISESVTSIGPGAFSGCKGLRIMKFEDNNRLTSISEAAFAASGLESIELDKCTNLTTIGMWAFANTPLTNVNLPESLVSLGDGAFYYNVKMVDINLPDELTYISNYLLAGNNSIVVKKPIFESGASLLENTEESYTIVKENVTTIGDYAFYNMDQLQEFAVPSNVQYIGTKAMAGQTNLDLVRAAPTTVPELGEEVWAGVNQHQIPLYTFPEVVEDYQAAEQWKEFAISYDPTNIDENIADVDSQVKAFFAGTMLNVKASSVIAKVSVFDINGVLLSMVTPASEQAELNTVNFNGKFYIVNVILANGKQQSFKLVRQ